MAVADVLNNEQVHQLSAGCEEVVNEILALDENHLGNRGSSRYCRFHFAEVESSIERNLGELVCADRAEPAPDGRTNGMDHSVPR